VTKPVCCKLASMWPATSTSLLTIAAVSIVPAHPTLDG
jgi:hypothetical protein